jgi:hypothetical protein
MVEILAEEYSLPPFEDALLSCRGGKVRNSLVQKFEVGKRDQQKS